jgi:hypothetical protein
MRPDRDLDRLHSFGRPLSDRHMVRSRCDLDNRRMVAFGRAYHLSQASLGGRRAPNPRPDTSRNDPCTEVILSHLIPSGARGNFRWRPFFVMRGGPAEYFLRCGTVFFWLSAPGGACSTGGRVSRLGRGGVTPLSIAARRQCAGGSYCCLPLRWRRLEQFLCGVSGRCTRRPAAAAEEAAGDDLVEPGAQIVLAQYPNKGVTGHVLGPGITYPPSPQKP